MSKFRKTLQKLQETDSDKFINYLGAIVENKELFEAEGVLPFSESAWNKIVSELGKPGLKQSPSAIETIYFLLLDKKMELSSGVLKVALKQLEANPKLKEKAELRSAVKARDNESPFDKGSNRASDFK